MASIAFPEQFTKVGLCALQHLAPGAAQLRAHAIDVEIQHRHRRAERRALAPPASLCGSFERQGNLARTGLGEHTFFQRQRVALSGYASGPARRMRLHDVLLDANSNDRRIFPWRLGTRASIAVPLWSGGSSSLSRQAALL